MPVLTDPREVTILWIFCLVESCRIHSGVDIKSVHLYASLVFVANTACNKSRGREIL